MFLILFSYIAKFTNTFKLKTIEREKLYNIFVYSTKFTYTFKDQINWERRKLYKILVIFSKISHQYIQTSRNNWEWENFTNSTNSTNFHFSIFYNANSTKISRLIVKQITTHIQTHSNITKYFNVNNFVKYSCHSYIVLHSFKLHKKVKLSKYIFHMIYCCMFSGNHTTTISAQLLLFYSWC